MSSKPYKTACKNCSCKCGIKKAVYNKDGSVNSEFEELYHEWKDTGETFQCYMRGGDACKIMRDALEYFDKYNG